MHTVAPIWRVAALIIPLASLVGCDWLPVRRRIDPSLYPVPSRPDAGVIRAHRQVSSRGPGADDLTPMAEIAADRPLPPLPELVRVSPEELFGPPVPTPLLDAALVRAQAIDAAVFEDDVEPQSKRDASTTAVNPANAALLLESSHTISFEPEETELSPPMVKADALEVPPIPDSLPEDIESTDGMEADAPFEAVSSDSPGLPDETEMVPPLAPSQDSGEHWKIQLTRLLEETRESLARGEGDAEVQAARQQMLDRLAEVESRAEFDDPNLWQTVMLLLGETELEPATGAIVRPDEGDPSEGPSLRVARVAFCREVLGFDRIRPLDAEALRDGQTVIVYCELEGVQYLPEADGHVSRLSSTLEILNHDDAPALWSNVQSVEDACSRPRHDYFVNYRLALPEGLSPGRYRLRLSQRDELSGEEALSEASFTIVSEGR